MKIKLLYIKVLSSFLLLFGIGELFAQPRYAKMTDTVFHVGDLIQHEFYLAFYRKPFPMKLPSENCLNIGEQSYIHFLELVKFIKSHPKLIFEIGCHDDLRASTILSTDHTKKWSEIIVDCMIRTHNIDSSRVKAVGYGREKPRTIYTCDGHYWAFPDDSLS
jgi:hypothetical protein